MALERSFFKGNVIDSNTGNVSHRQLKIDTKFKELKREQEVRKQRQQMLTTLSRNLTVHSIKMKKMSFSIKTPGFDP